MTTRDEQTATQTVTERPDTEVRSVLHGTFTLERRYPHSRDRVFAAFAEPEAIRAWLVEGEGWEIASFDMDFQVGGRQVSRFRFEGGPWIENHTTYHDIVPGERIVFAYWMSAEGERFSVSLTTVELREADGGAATELVFTEHDAFLDGNDGLEARKKGTAGLLDELGAWLEADAES